MDITELFQNYGLALGLGLLVGIQRERSAARLAGFRTFPLVTLWGCLGAHLASSMGGGFLVAAAVALAVLTAAGHISQTRGPNEDPGLTTETAILVMFGVGALAMTGPRVVAVVLGTAVAVLLHLKPQMHGFAAKISDADFQAMMQFAVVSLIILPLLPDRNYGPFDVFNPQRIWWMMVLITGISLGGYISYQWFGAAAGTAVAGLLGGLISSTATTLSYARRAQEATSSAAQARAVILLAGTVVFGRVMVELAVVCPSQWWVVGQGVLILMAVMGFLALLAWRHARQERIGLPPQANPTEWKSAVVFTVVYAGVLLAVAVARDYWGTGGLYVVAVLSGLTDMDAITLSTGEMVEAGRLSAVTGGRVVVLASLANLAFKGGAILLLAPRRFALGLLGRFAVVVATGVAVLVWW